MVYKLLFLWYLCVSSLLWTSVLSETISPNKLIQGFEGYYSPCVSFPGQNQKNDQRAKQQSMQDEIFERCYIGMSYFESNQQQSFTENEIKSLKFELFQTDTMNPNTVLLSINLENTQTENGWTSWEGIDHPMNVRIMKGEQLLEEYQCNINFTSHLNVWHALPFETTASLSIVAPKDQQKCHFDISVPKLNFFRANRSTILYSSFLCLIILIQIIVVIFLLYWIHTNVVMQSKISAISVTILQIISINNFQRIVYFMMNERRLIFIAPLFLSFLLCMFVGRLMMVLFRLRVMFPIIRKNLFLLTGPMIGYTALKMFFPFQLWSTIIAPVCLFTPQIIKNIRNRGVPQICYSYLYGLLFIQILEPLYYYSCKNNVFLLRPSILNSLVYSFTYLIFTTIIILQYCLGSKFLVNKQAFLHIFFQYKYQYIVKQGQQIANCPICLQLLTCNFDQDGHSKPATSVINTSLADELLTVYKNEVAKTPCNHLFHKFCLREWTRTKLECPNCRQQIPPMIL